MKATCYGKSYTLTLSRDEAQQLVAMMRMNISIPDVLTSIHPKVFQYERTQQFMGAILNALSRFPSLKKV